jgi:hypothetical protein
VPSGVDRDALTDKLGENMRRLHARDLTLTVPRALALLLLGLGGAPGCGDSDRAPPLGSSTTPIAGCEDFSYRPCDILTESCQREVFALVACVRGGSAVSRPPPVRQLDEASAIALVAEASAMGSMTDGVDAMSAMTLDARAFRAEVRGLELLGLLEPGLITDVGDVLDQSVSSAIAYYLPSTREVVIIDRGDPIDDLEANTVLAHEFVHALQDAQHDLTTFGADLVFDSDGNLAISSLIEGEASLYQYLLGFAYQGTDVGRVNFSSFFASLTGLGLEVTLDAGSPALTAESIFPYTFGAAYAGRAWLSGGSRGLDDLYQAPPRTSWEVLRGESDTARSVSTFGTAPAALDGYTLEGQDVVGAWVSVAMLAGLASGSQLAGELPDLASRWQGDRYWIYDTADEPGAVAALWAIDWADADSAARFSTLAAALAPPGAVLRIDTAGVSTRLVAVERPEDLDAWRARLAELAPE